MVAASNTFMPAKQSQAYPSNLTEKIFLTAIVAANINAKQKASNHMLIGLLMVCVVVAELIVSKAMFDPQWIPRVSHNDFVYINAQERAIPKTNK